MTDEELIFKFECYAASKVRNRQLAKDIAHDMWILAVEWEKRAKGKSRFVTPWHWYFCQAYRKNIYARPPRRGTPAQIAHIAHPENLQVSNENWQWWLETNWFDTNYRGDKAVKYNVSVGNITMKMSAEEIHEVLAFKKSAPPLHIVKVLKRDKGRDVYVIDGALWVDLKKAAAFYGTDIATVRGIAHTARVHVS